MALIIGQKAPAFTLSSDEDKPVSLSEYTQKNVLLLFFPMAFSSVCTAELCEMRDNLHTYASLNADILAISVDSPATLAKFKAEENLPFTLLSDANKDVSEAYGALYEDSVKDMKGMSKRAAFVIDQNDIIQYAEVLDNAGKLPDFESIKSTLAGLK